MNGISSYALKITGIHLKQRNPGDDWSDSNLPLLFIKALKLLQEFLDTNNNRLLQYSV